MFDLFSDILAGLYALWPSYGAMIILLTLLVRILFTPLTVRGTKSMLEMRRIQPELKKLQAKHKGDRAALNQEVQALYRTHKINPLGGCLPLLAQAPVFLVMYQVLRGLTRRISEVGKTLGNVVSQLQIFPSGPVEDLDRELERLDIGKSNFNPRYVDEGTQLFKDLSSDTEMLWLGIDLSFSPSAALSESFVKALPYLLMVILVGVLGFYQQRQIAGRNPDVEVNPMQRTLMRVLPIFLPVISFSLPAGLIVYFITTSAIGVGQQAFITRRVYKPWNEAEEKRKELLESEDPEEEASGGGSEKPKGLLEGLFGPKQEDTSIHGRRRPSSAPPPRPKAKPPSAKEAPAPQSKATQSKATQSKATQPKAGGQVNKSSKSSANNNSNSKNSRQISNSKRVTPSKKQIEEANRNKKKRRR